MAMNLRLGPVAEAALRAEAQRTGRTQQDLLREAVDQYLGLAQVVRTEADAIVAAGLARPARTPYRKVTPRRTLPQGVNSLELLDRDDRI